MLNLKVIGSRINSLPPLTLSTNIGALLGLPQVHSLEIWLLFLQVSIHHHKLYYHLSMPSLLKMQTLLSLLLMRCIRNSQEYSNWAMLKL